MRRGRRPTVLGALAALTVLVAGLRPAVAQNLTAADARKITAAVVQEANARGV